MSFHALIACFFSARIIFHHLDVPQFIHSPTKGYLGCVQVLAIIHKAANYTSTSYFTPNYCLFYLHVFLRKIISSVNKEGFISSLICGLVSDIDLGKFSVIIVSHIFVLSLFSSIIPIMHILYLLE